MLFVIFVTFVVHFFAAADIASQPAATYDHI
jgi:hypothetical protein